MSEISLERVQRHISEECDKVKALLLQKNADYGSTFLYPVHIFSNSAEEEQIKVRIDDKLTRLKNLPSNPEFTEDTELDLIGYLILLRVARRVNDRN